MRWEGDSYLGTRLGEALGKRRIESHTKAQKTQNRNFTQSQGGTAVLREHAGKSSLNAQLTFVVVGLGAEAISKSVISEEPESRSQETRIGGVGLLQYAG